MPSYSRGIIHRREKNIPREDWMDQFYSVQSYIAILKLKNKPYAILNFTHEIARGFGFDK